MEQTQVFGTSGTPDQTMVVPNGGATMQMPAGGATVMGNDPMRTQLGGVATCPVCRTNTPAMETYCGECGFLLASPVSEDAAPPPEEAPVAELVDIADGRRFRLKPGVNTVGRMGTDVLILDTTVSRNHATITIDGDRVMVEDLGSSNGTKVGETRLGANQPTVAAPGTPLKFGNWRVTLEMGAAKPGGSNEQTVMSPLQDRTVTTFPEENSPAPAAEDALSTPPPNAESALPQSPGDAEGTSSGAVTIPENSELIETPIVPLEPAFSAPVAKLEKIEGMSSDIEIEFGSLTIGRKPGNDLALPLDSYISGRHAEILADASGVYLTDVGSTNGTVVNGQKLTPNERQPLIEGDEVQLGQTRFRFVSLTNPASPALPAEEQA